ncbi:outer membrane protein [Bradyrhizobium sp.]|uniref:outer membrane protein n=1 Tax=Bradyrhizobium sp. TaxID=376 RepID=UPI002D4266C8|nr:outer membrane beta-barrel protein [Bradyrhizobium sp.]HZR77466.1 outer membrane beta-barrel protein [Bradyrhizobium sp.]
MKRRFLFGFGLSLVAAAGPAGAADLSPVYKAPVAAAPSLYNWTGFYFGGTVGGGVASLPNVVLETPGTEGPLNGTSLKSGALVGGLHAGYNWQFNRSSLFGIEGDFNWTSLKDSSTTCVGPCTLLNNQNPFVTSSKLDDFGTIRARFGLANDRTLVYVTAGPAFGHINASFSENNIVTGLSAAQSHESSFHWGVAAGAGVEYAIAPNWILRGEYLHLNFESKDTPLTGTAYQFFPIAGNSFASRASATADIARIGVSYKPWDGAPIVDAAPVVKATPPGWTGFYFGGTVGGGVASLPVTDVDSANGNFFTSGPSMKSTGAVGGLHAGYNWQASPSFLFGVEGDFNWTGLKNTTTACLGLNECLTTASKLDNFGTVRARFGLTTDRTLFYVTAGPAYGHIDASHTDFVPPLTPANLVSQSNDSHYHWGTAVGAGVEYALTQNWILRGEYLHLNFVNNDVASTNALGVPTPAFRTRSSAEADIARVGLSYKPWASAGLPAEAPFNWTGAYIGGSAGFGMGSMPVTDMDNFNSDANGQTLKSAGVVGGAHLGYNWQIGSTAVVGVEGDFNGMGFRDSDSTCHGSTAPNCAFVSSSRLDDYGSIRARFGLTSGRTMAYVTAGPAFGHITGNYTNAGGVGVIAGDDSFHAGLAAGAGLEYALTSNWILRGQYMHLNFENKTVTITNNAGVPFNNSGFSARYSASADIAQVGISYKPW